MVRAVHPRFSLNTITISGWHLPELLEACVDKGVEAVGLWRHDFEAIGLASAGDIIEDSGLRVSSLCRGGMFPAFTEPGFRASVADNLRAIDEAATLRASALVLVCGPRQGLDFSTARRMVRRGIEAILPRAAEAGLKLAVEPLHPMLVDDRSVIVTLGEANDIVAEFDHPDLGIALDAYHVFWDPRLDEEIERARHRIFTYQVSDWIIPIEGGLTSRAMMGDGSIDLVELTRKVESAGYAGDIEVEVMSTALWELPPSSLLDRCIERFEALWATGGPE